METIELKPRKIKKLPGVILRKSAAEAGEDTPNMTLRLDAKLTFLKICMIVILMLSGF